MRHGLLGLALVIPISGSLRAEPAATTMDLDAEDPEPPPEEAVPFSMPVAQAQANVDAALGVIRWTAPKAMTAADLAGLWGIRTSRLLALNPGLGALTKLEPGSSWVAYRRTPQAPTVSIGAPNRGRLRNGMPLPEGPHWVLRPSRRRTWGTTITVGSLLTAFEAYGARFPDAPPIRVGELSSRSGGRAFPHSSHRTGRDVDLGYVLSEQPAPNRYWRTAREHNFDAEKTWFFVRSLIETGDVQRIFVSQMAAEKMLEVAKREMTPEQLADIFRIANPDRSERPIIRYWRGHRDHMHVRFRCEDGNQRCRSRSTGKRKRR